MFDDCVGIKITINGTPQYQTIDPKEEQELRKKIFFEKILKEILRLIPRDDRRRDRKITQISRLLNLTVAANLQTQASSCLPFYPNLSFRKKGEYTLELVIREAITISSKICFYVASRENPDRPHFCLEGKIEHRLDDNAATYCYRGFPVSPLQ
jgi:hypothetical protein